MQLLCGGINFLMTLQSHVLFLEQCIDIFCVGDYSIFVSVSYIVFMCVVYIASLCCIWFYVHVFCTCYLHFLFVYICMLNKNTLGVKKVRGQSEAALQTGATKNFDIS